MNLAALWQLPVLFLCENNYYAMGTALDRYESQTDLCVKASSYKMPAVKVDGMDVVAVHETIKRAVSHVRAGNGPYFVELQAYRFRPHSMFDPELYRARDEVDEWRRRDPIQQYYARLSDEGKLSEAEYVALGANADQEINNAVDFAEAGTFEPIEDLHRDVYTTELVP
jgi:pyruvate dehydrogenase E1 component alpha subunit